MQSAVGWTSAVQGVFSRSVSVMASKSYARFLDLAGKGILEDLPQLPRFILTPATVPGAISESDSGQSCCAKIIIVANFLPVISQKDPINGRWGFTLDEDSLYLQLKETFQAEYDVYFVGSLKVDIDPLEQDEVARRLLEDFNCVPTFLPPHLRDMFYHGFCKQYLWPLFHYMLPMSPDHGNRYDRNLWLAYVSANKIFADRVHEIINPDDDFVWVHDYHLMLVSTFLRKRHHRVKLGFFLHSPFPSSEIYRTLPVRDEILKAFLNADLIGFHTFDYARHFLSCCSRMLGLDYKSRRGHLGIEYLGRTIYVKILPVGIHVRHLQSALDHPIASHKVQELKKQFEGKTLIVGVDDMDIFKGISLKLLAMEHLLNEDPSYRGKLVLVQIVNPARSTGKDVIEARSETYQVARRVNETYGCPGYQPVIIIDRPLPIFEKTAYYALAECCIVNAVRDGLNQIPYKYIVCRQGSAQLDEAMGIAPGSPRSSMLVVSEFIGCSPSLSGAIRVNPWDIDAVASAIISAIRMKDVEKQLRHEKHYRYVTSHDVGYWARSYLQDLERSCKDHFSKRVWTMGFGLSIRTVALDPSFRKLSVDYLLSVYKRTTRRAIFLDYDGTIVCSSSIDKSPTPGVIAVLNALCKDPCNTVFIVSGRGRDVLGPWFNECSDLGIAAEHGYFMRWNKVEDWRSSSVAEDNDWKKIALPVMQLYTETTDGSYIEAKESALVWHHHDADRDFGHCQSMELLDHLENVLSNEPVVVTRGYCIVEVKPPGVSKGLVVENVLSELTNVGKQPDLLLCIGDDRSDEDMFEYIQGLAPSDSGPGGPEVFACTVGQKPSKASYYVNDTGNVKSVLSSLASISTATEENDMAMQLQHGHGGATVTTPAADCSA